MNKNLLHLPSVTLVSVTGIDPRRNLRALEVSRVGIGFAEVLLLSRITPKAIPDAIKFEKIKADLWSYNEFSRFVLYELYKHVHTEFALFVHHGATVLRPNCWSDEFLSYDYIGAPWKPGVHSTDSGREVVVGNGGFSLRSQKLMKAPTDLSLPFTDNGTGFFHEDGQICVYHRDRLEGHGITFAPVEIAAKFATETWRDGAVSKPFGYHNTRSAKPFLFETRNKLRRLQTHAR
jgi:hypothetical protein